MKKIWIGILVLSFLAVPFLIRPRTPEQPLMVAQAQPTAEDEQESSFWSSFRKVFSRSEPDWSKGNQQVSTAAGARGVDQEGKLKEAYDYQAVKWMEQYSVKEDAVMKFLKNRGLGPYKGKGAKGEDQ